jgi:hypothetical protein
MGRSSRRRCWRATMGADMKKLVIIDDAWSGYALREPDVDGGRTVALTISNYSDATLLAAAPVMFKALNDIVKRFDPLGVAAPDCARCEDCNLHPSVHAHGCTIKGALEAVATARGRVI